MNIWIVNHYARGPSEVGGTRHYSLARELAGRGHRVLILASSRGHWTGRETLHAKETFRLEEQEGVPFLWLRTPSYTGNSGGRVWNMIVFAWRVLRGTGAGTAPRPDVVIGSSPHPLGALAARSVARRHGVPFVLEVRDLWPETLVQLGRFSSRHPVVWLLTVLELQLFRRAARIISLLPRGVDYIANRGIAPDRVVWIPNGVDLRLVPAPAPPPAGRPFTVAYAGAHGMANSLDTVLDCAGLLRAETPERSIEFRLVGNGPEKSRLIRRVSDEGLDNVRFEDPLPKDQVYGFLAQADACLISIHDSPLYVYGVSPNKLYDYFAAARPTVIATTMPSNPVDECGAGLTIPSYDAEAMAGACRRLHALSTEERWEMGLRGRRFVEAQHSFVLLGEKLESTLLDVIRERRTA